MRQSFLGDQNARHPCRRSPWYPLHGECSSSLPECYGRATRGSGKGFCSAHSASSHPCARGCWRPAGNCRSRHSLAYGVVAVVALGHGPAKVHRWIDPGREPRVDPAGLAGDGVGRARKLVGYGNPHGHRSPGGNPRPRGAGTGAGARMVHHAAALLHGRCSVCRRHRPAAWRQAALAGGLVSRSLDVVR